LINRLESYEAAITAQLAAHPSLTLQLRDWLKENYTLETSISAVARFVRQIGHRCQWWLVTRVLGLPLMGRHNEKIFQLYAEKLNCLLLMLRITPLISTKRQFRT
jgi:hypothetical protein